MESAADLECAYALEILAFEEESDRGMRWGLPFERGTNKGFRCLGGRRKVRKGGGS